jgi:hypothetical protein
MKEIEKFLAQDSWRFGWIAREIRGTSPGSERDKILESFWKSVWKTGYYKAEYDLIKTRCWFVCRYVALCDEQLSDVSGQQEDQERRERKKASRIWEPGRGLVCRPCNLGTSGPSHVEDGGGAAAQRSKEDLEDRSSPVQSTGSPAGSDSHNVGTDPEVPV